MQALRKCSGSAVSPTPHKVDAAPGQKGGICRFGQNNLDTWINAMDIRPAASLDKPSLLCSDAPRLRCRDRRCQCALPEPAEHRQAFCARGCYTHFYRTRCKV